MSTVVLTVVLVLCGLFVSRVSGQTSGSYGFQTLLTGYDGGVGTAHVYLDASASVLVVAAQWSGLSGAPTFMHIHGCLPSPPTLFNTSGVIINLTPTISQFGLLASGETLATFDLTQTSTYKWGSSASAAAQQLSLLQCLQNGTAYYNIHTVQRPAGELSGIFQQTTQVISAWANLNVTAGISVASTGSGNASLLYNANTHEVFISASFSGLTSNTTGIHWHGCSNSNTVPTKQYIIKINPSNALSQIAAGFVSYYNLLNSTGYLDSSFINAIPNFTPQLGEQTIHQCLLNASTTLNVHTQDNTGGEISAWFNITHAVQPLSVSPDALSTYTALLGAYAVNGAAGLPVGYAVAALDVNKQLLSAGVTIFSPGPGLTGNPSLAHIHGCTSSTARFPFGSAGVMVPLNPNTIHPGGTGVTGEFQNVFSSADADTYDSTFYTAQGLAAGQWWLAEALAYKCAQNEQTYVNIHTVANPGGEATGVLSPSNQVLLLTVPKFTIASNASAPSTATASAYLLWDLAAHLLWVNVTWSGLTSAVTAAHIHGCLPNTGIAIPLTVNANNQLYQSIDTSNPSSFNSAFYTNSTLYGQAWYAESLFATCLFNNTLYINIHTNNNKGGEVQGTIQFDTNFVVPSTAPAPTTAISAAVQFTLSIFSMLMPVALAVLALL